MGKESKKPMINEQLKREIFAMVEADQKMRQSYEWNSEVDNSNTERMKEIIRQYGWPGKTLVGEEAANGAWLLVQHADHDVEFQNQALKFLQEAVAKGEAEKINAAYLIDRVRVNNGHPQIFGTQFYKNKEDKFGPRPVEDIEHIEERRKEFGLGLFSEYEQLMYQKHKSFEEQEKAKNK